MKTYDAMTMMKDLKVQIPGRWTSIGGEDFNGEWIGWELTLPVGQLRLTSQDFEAEFQVHVLDDRGFVRYSMNFTQTPFRVALAAVEAAVNEMVGR